MGNQTISLLLQAESDPAAMKQAIEDMYMHAENDGSGEEYHSELKEHNLFQLRLTFRQMMYQFVDEEQFEKAAVLRDSLREKSWQ